MTNGVTVAYADVITEVMPASVRGRASPRPKVLNCLFSCCLFFFPVSVLASSHIVIGEVNWAGSSRSIADEWVEIWNTSSEDQSLAGWSLEGASVRPILFKEMDIIPAHQIFLLSNYDETNPKSSLAFHPSLVTTDVALSNDTLRLVLRDPQGRIVDEAGNGGKPLAGATKPLASMLRVELGQSGGDALGWATATTTQHFDPDVPDLGTPGICDGCDMEELPASEPTPPLPSVTPVPIPAETASSTSNEHALTPLIPEDTGSSTSTSPQEQPEDTATSSPPSTGLEDTVAAPADPPLVAEEELVVDSPSVPPEESSTSSTEDIPVIESTSSPVDVLKSPPPSEAVTTTSPLLPTFPDCDFKLMTIFPAPSEGPEWVEVSECEDVAALRGWSIHDANGLVLTISSSTAITQAENGGWHIPLPGQHLNNGGDTVSLRAPNGGLYDTVAYPALKRDEHYSRQDSGTWWIPERAPVPESSPVTLPSPSPSVSTPVITTITLSPSSTTPLIAATSSTKTITTKATVKIIPKSASTSTIAKTSPKKVTSMTFEEYERSKLSKTAKSNASSPVKKASSAKTVTTKKPSPVKSSPMSSSSSPAPRVHLHGVVGTAPNLVAKRRFVLLSENGTGLLVYGSTQQPSPPLGSSIDIHGTLITNDDGVHLEMRTNDRWTPAASLLPVPQVSPIDILSATPEQAWSLVELVGRVQTRNTTNIHIEVDDTEITVLLPRLLGYRPQRLQKGDLVRIRGVLDTRGNTLELYPRTVEDIILVERVNSSPTSTVPAIARHSSLPPWAPIGAAATTIAAGYGFLRWRTWYKQRQLQRQLTLAIDHLPSN